MKSPIARKTMTLFTGVSLCLVSAAASAAPLTHLSPGLEARLQSTFENERIGVILELRQDAIFTYEAKRAIARLNGDRPAQKALIERIYRKEAAEAFQLIDQAVKEGGDVSYFWHLGYIALLAPISVVRGLGASRAFPFIYFNESELNKPPEGDMRPARCTDMFERQEPSLGERSSSSDESGNR